MNHDRERAMALYDSLLGTLAGAGAVAEPG